MKYANNLPIPRQNRNFTSNDYYSNTYMASHFPKYVYFLTIGSRGRGKTYSGKKYAIKWILNQWNNKEIKKFMWWRLTNDAVNKMLENNGSTFFESELLEKYGINVSVVNNDLFFAKRAEAEIDEAGATNYKWKHVGKVASIQEYYKFKGNQFNGYDLIIMDELVRAESEKRTFNIPRAFINMVENVARKRKVGSIRVLIYANAIGEMQEVKQLFGFMPLPGRFGVYKLYHKRAIIEYLDDSEEWKKEQAQTYAGLLSTSSEFTNVHFNPLDDKDDIFVERKNSSGKNYFCSIKIEQGIFLTIYSFKGNYFIDTENYTSKGLKRMNNYAMGRDLVTTTTLYSKEIIKFIQEIWDVGKFRFSSPIVYEWFTKSLSKYNVVKF